MITALAAIGFTSPNADAWRTFGPDVLGAELAPDGPDGAVRLRVDDAAHRIEISPGDTTTSRTSAGRRRLDARRASTRERTRPTRSFVDPFGFRHELVAALEAGPPFTPGRPMRRLRHRRAGARPRRAARARPRRGRAVLHRRASVCARPTRSRAASPSGSSTAPATPPATTRWRSPRCRASPGSTTSCWRSTALDDVGTALDVVNARVDPVGDEPRAPHQRPDDVVLRAHAVGLRDRVRHRRPRRRRRHVDATARSTPGALGPQAAGRRTAAPGIDPAPASAERRRHDACDDRSRRRLAARLAARRPAPRATSCAASPTTCGSSCSTAASCAPCNRSAGAAARSTTSSSSTPSSRSRGPTRPPAGSPA